MPDTIRAWNPAHARGTSTYDLIEKTSLIEADLRDGAAGLRRVIDRLRGQSEEGIEHVIVNLPNAEELGPLEAFGREVIPALSA